MFCKCVCVASLRQPFGFHARKCAGQRHALALAVHSPTPSSTPVPSSCRASNCVPCVLVVCRRININITMIYLLHHLDDYADNEVGGATPTKRSPDLVDYLTDDLWLTGDITRLGRSHSHRQSDGMRRREGGGGGSFSP